MCWWQYLTSVMLFVLVFILEKTRHDLDSSMSETISTLEAVCFHIEEAEQARRQIASAIDTSM